MSDPYFERLFAMNKKQAEIIDELEKTLEQQRWANEMLNANNIDLRKKIVELEAKSEDYTEYNKLNHKNHCLQQRNEELEAKLEYYAANPWT